VRSALEFRFRSPNPQSDANSMKWMVTVNPD
jgi:hypothetical protein